MNELVNTIATFIQLRFVKSEPQLLPARSNNSFNGIQVGPEGKPVWEWPQDGTPIDFETEMRSYNVVPAMALMELFLSQESELPKKIFNQKLLAQFQAMKEILVAGDTNRLVAELTFVRINDLAAPPEDLDPLLYIEPVVAFLIVMNGILIGFQTDRQFESWKGWPYVEAGFAGILVLECVVRIYLCRPRKFFCGSEWLWNIFDLFLVATAVADVVSQFAVDQNSDMAVASLLRFCRLIRLVRVVKVFRLHCMKELRLMVKGLVGGLRTLAMSFALLFTVLYVISGLATMTLGRDARTAALGLQSHFENIPQSMFTAFRCFSGECFADSGVPIAAVLVTEYGVSFGMSYVLGYMLVSMGMFNVILAVYVDITMRAAKETESVSAEQYSRESIRIARTTRELLKKFAEAYRLFHDTGRSQEGRSKGMDALSTNAFTDDDIQDIAITKELFLLVIQDQSVQKLMDDLDLPADRANLFEVIDADASSTLHVTELVQGLLKIRGDLTKSDTVATLLATKSVHSMLAAFKEDYSELRAGMLALLRSQKAGGKLGTPYQGLVNVVSQKPAAVSTISTPPATPEAF
ncbi:unnamed protein product [Effrenium voratum]|nr:unnamed protein product [Effrenium voratum]